MSTTQEEPTLHELVSRLAALEQANGRLQEELTSLRAERATAEEQAGQQTLPRARKNSRRKVLTRGLGVVVASVGAGAMLEVSGGTALAERESVKPGVFASSTAGTPAVSASGTNGAHGVDATSDSSIGVSATSGSGTGLVAQSTSGIGLHAVGGGTNPGTPPNNFTEMAIFAEGGPAPGIVATSIANAVVGQSSFNAGVLGQSSSGTGASGGSTSGAGVLGVSKSGAGVWGVSSSGTGVFGQSSSGQAGSFDGNVDVNGSFSAFGTNGIGVTGFSNTNTGVLGQSSSGTGVLGRSTSGLAGRFEGDVQVNGNFSATGTKNFVQAHPTDPSREIVYVALEGGEAGTYVRGTGQLVNGKAVLALPEHFGLVTAYEGLTIQFAPRGEWLQLYTVELDATQAVVREAQGKSGEFDYFICGVRRGYEQHEVIRAKR